MTKPAGQKNWWPANSEGVKSTKQSAVPTTFVETDSESFRELVQKLTGISHEKKLPGRNLVPSDGSSVTFLKSGIEVGPRKSAFKLQDRRQFSKKLEIKLGHGSSHGRSPDSVLFQGNGLSPNLIPSPITPLGPDPFTSSSTCYWSEYCYSPCSSVSTPTSCNKSRSEEEEKEFSFQVSPTMRSPKSEPKLLPLFPLHSPRESKP